MTALLAPTTAPEGAAGRSPPRGARPAGPGRWAAVLAPGAARGGGAGRPPGGTARRSARWRLLVCIAIVVAALGWIAVRGLTGSFVYYLTPTDVRLDHKAQVDQRIRLGGYV